MPLLGEAAADARVDQRILKKRRCLSDVRESSRYSRSIDVGLDTRDVKHLAVVDPVATVCFWPSRIMAGALHAPS